ncbi:MAG: universal stress protein [Pseudolysinimonas sp.]
MDGRYVVGVDGSAPSDAAVRWAIERAEREQRQVVLAHVRDPEAGMMGADFARDEDQHAAQLLRRLQEEFAGAAVELSVELLEGPVAWALGSAVMADDIVVVGTHKIGFLHGRVLGSRSVQIASGVPCSVAVIPDVDLRFRRGVVAGVDRVEIDAEIAHVAAAEADARGEELIVIQAVHAGDARRSELPVGIAESAARAMFPTLSVRSRVTTRPAAEALLDAALDKALLVLGPGSGDPQRSPIGSVLHDVLLNVNAPVLVARRASDRELVGPVAHQDAGPSGE